MAFLSSMNVVGSGLTAQQLRLDVISENVTNMNTTRTEEGGPYRRKMVVLEEENSPSPFRQALNRAMGMENPQRGGVRVTEIAEDPSDFRIVYDPTNPDANAEGYVEKLADIFEGYNEETDQWGAAGGYEDAERLVNKMQESRDDITERWASLSADVTFLNSNATQLESTFYSLNTERSTIEDVDQVDAIMEYVWAQTCYNAAHQVGTSVIPQSLMDYLR